MHGSADTSIIDAFVFQADVAALRLARLAVARSADAPARPAGICSVTSLHERRLARASAPMQPSFPGDAA